MSRASPLPRSGDRSKAVMMGVIKRFRMDDCRCPGRVVAVGVVKSDQVPPHDFPSGSRPATRPSMYRRMAGPGFDKSFKESADARPHQRFWPGSAAVSDCSTETRSQTSQLPVPETPEGKNPSIPVFPVRSPKALPPEPADPRLRVLVLSPVRVGPPCAL